MNDEIFRMLFAGRYILLLMGIFSLFTGVVYNDAFSRPLRLFDSGWHFFRRVPHKTPVPVLKRVYPVGIDTVWVQASNSLTFLNAYKMKQAVLMGLAQMYFGIFLGAANHVHFKRHAALWYETAPQLLFLTAIFGYLGFLIVFKWVFAPKAAASILTTMIDMVLTPFSFDARLQLFRGQHRVQIFLLAVALLCVVWLLFAKPLYMRRLRRLRNQSYTALDVGVGAAAASGSPTASVDSALHGEEADAKGCDAFITQAIHTIEFVLGTVSNTASYLRLWALSLAHSQLSEVLWTMVIRNTASSGVVIAVLGFALWLFLTVFILVVMEGLSAFLHSLRLHWVEFNGRFFVGEGKPFLPLTFEDCDGDDCN